MDSPVLSSRHMRPLEEIALERDSLPAGTGSPPWPQDDRVLKVYFMLYFCRAMWEGCSLSLHCTICCAFGWKFFLWSPLYWKSLLCKILPQSLSPHQSGPECRLQFCLQSYCRAFSILISFGCPERLVDNGNYTALVKPAAMLSLKYPKMEAKR